MPSVQAVKILHFLLIKTSSSIFGILIAFYLFFTASTSIFIEF